MTQESDLRTTFFRANRTIFVGSVYDEADLTKKFCVELLIDGQAVAVCLCDEPVAEFVEAGIGDGHFGFTFNIPEETIANCAFAEARLANLGWPVGRSIACNERSPPMSSIQIAELHWVGGLRFEGWVDEGAGQSIEILVSEESVMTISPKGWTYVGGGEAHRSARRLDFYLPDQFADGRVHHLLARTATGRTFPQPAITFVAFDQGLERTLSELGRWESEKVRGKLFDQLVPPSLPFHLYDDWKERFPYSAGKQNALEAAILLIGDGDIGESIDSLENQEGVAWSAISLPTRGTFSRFDRRAALEFLEADATASDFVIFCLGGTIFSNNALARFAEAFEEHPEYDCIYGDVDIQAQDGKLWPLAFPALDLERMLEQGYAAMLFAMRRELASAAIESSDTVYGLFNYSLASGSTSSIGQLPGALGAVPRIDSEAAARELIEATRKRLAEQGIRATVERRMGSALPAVRVRREFLGDRTTIIIPTRNRVELLRKCIESILPAVHEVQGEILVVDNESTDPATLGFLAAGSSYGFSVLRLSGVFNFARLNNAAVRHCETDNVCLLNNDIEALDDVWLSEMLSRLADPGVGAVGAKLLWPNGVVQHGGVVLGMNFAAAHAFNDRMDGDPGYGDLLEVAHECSAVTAACFALRKRDYVAVGGMDEISFPVNFNDVDLCLKLRAQGKRIVFSPDAKLTHLESASRGRDEAPDRKARFERELLMLRSKWGDVILDDPYYSPILGLDAVPFSSLAWPPRSRKARANRPPIPSKVPTGF